MFVLDVLDEGPLIPSISLDGCGGAYRPAPAELQTLKIHLLQSLIFFVVMLRLCPGEVFLECRQASVRLENSSGYQLFITLQDPVDRAGAKEIGMKAIKYIGSNPEAKRESIADVVIDNLAELPEALNRL